MKLGVLLALALTAGLASRAFAAAERWRLVTQDDATFGLVDMESIEATPAGVKLRLAMVKRVVGKDGTAFLVGSEILHCGEHTETLTEVNAYDSQGRFLLREPNSDEVNPITEDSHLDHAYALACKGRSKYEDTPEYGDLPSARAALLKGEIATD